MALSQHSGVVMLITKVQRNGAGLLIDTDISFRWNGIAHSSAQGVISPKLVSKIVRKEIPGSNQVVHQAMSSTWQPFTLKGEWRDIWMGQGAAWQTYLEFSSMCRTMPLVRCNIDSLSFVGMIQELEIGYHHEGWIEWSFVLSPENNNNVDRAAVLGAGVTHVTKPIPQWVKDVTDSHAGLKQAVSRATAIQLSDESFEDAVAAKAELDDSVDRLTSLTTSSGIEGLSADLVSSINSTGSDVTELVWQLPTYFERVRRAAINTAVAVKDQRADLSLAFDDFLEALRFTKFVHETTASCWNIVGFSRDAAVDMQSRTSKKPRAIYVVRNGDTLERISVRFYGTADNASLIYRANNLDSIALVGGSELIIPEQGA